MRLFYHDAALADIEGILDYIEPHNPAAAIRLAEGILDTCEFLEKHPEAGACRDDLKSGLRVLSHRGYGIYYSLDAEHQMVNIGRVLHPRLNVSAELFDKPYVNRTSD